MVTPLLRTTPAPFATWLASLPNAGPDQGIDPLLASWVVFEVLANPRIHNHRVACLIPGKVGITST